jgi:hypothetical protein
MVCGGGDVRAEAGGEGTTGDEWNSAKSSSSSSMFDCRAVRIAGDAYVADRGDDVDEDDGGGTRGERGGGRSGDGPGNIGLANGGGVTDAGVCICVRALEAGDASPSPSPSG